MIDWIMSKSKIFFLLLLAISFFSACEKEGEGELTSSNSIRLSLDVEDAQMRFSGELRATPEEEAIEQVMVFFFETNGNVFSRPYEFSKSETSNKVKWESANTMLIPLSPEETNQKKVVVVANYKNKGGLETALKAIRNYSELTGLLYESATSTKSITAPGLLMQGEVMHTFTKANRTATVALKRCMAKLSVALYLKWQALDARLMDKNFYQFRDVARDTYLRERVSLLTAANRTAYYNENPATTDKLWAFTPHASTQEGPLLITVYLNEYDQGNDKANYPPHLFLKLFANIPASNADDAIGIYPPPAGEDVVPAEQRDCYYRLLLPRKIERNKHYIVEAQILSAGSSDITKPLDLISEILIVPWKEVPITGNRELLLPGELYY